MNRQLTYLLGPECAMVLLTAAVFLFCARHYSYSSRDVDILNNLLWSLPVIAVSLAYATFFVPGEKSWWWLGRATIAVLVALVICANKVENGFVAPGAGPGAGGTGIFIALCFGAIFAALANAVAGALILAELRPSFAAWFHSHRVIGSVLTALASVPIALAMMAILGALVGIHVFFITLFKR